MIQYEEEYFFIQPSENIKILPYLQPDASTAGRKFEYEEQLIGTPPLVFFNANKDEHRLEGIPCLKDMPPVLFRGNDLLVSTEIRREILALKIDYLSLHPAVYIDDDGDWHEDFWFCTFKERFECLDMEESVTIGSIKVNRGTPNEKRRYDVTEHYFDRKIMNDIPLENRLIFKLGGVVDAYITCHKSVKHIFENVATNVISVGDWE